MNQIELEMVHLLGELAERHGVSGVKAEFEAEGTRTEELMRLKEICLAAQISLTLKIGGCEAVRDMYDARAVGVDHVVAPMVETRFALQKYLRAIETVFPRDEQEEIEFLINVETRLAVENFDEMLKVANLARLDGIVMGRVDLVGSMGLDRKAMNTDRIFQLVVPLFQKAKHRKMTCVLGGGIAVDALPFIRAIPSDLIDRYETRKICFACPDALEQDAEQGILKAVRFELLWLHNKRSYYKAISEEDDRRISMLETRVVR
ncbi:MAG TPA: aldolase/citrate lyase family protein [Syntrophobacteria bacterium]|nr:aldolase/citrate lyase family protein [Syntrophobacteria bacterium]